jgi:hypothetical protein
MNSQVDDLLKISAPAQRALESIGVTTPAQIIQSDDSA